MNSTAMHRKTALTLSAVKHAACLPPSGAKLEFLSFALNRLAAGQLQSTLRQSIRQRNGGNEGYLMRTFKSIIDEACQQETLLDALTWICLWETDRILTRAHAGIEYETSFYICLSEVVKTWKLKHGEINGL